MIKLLIIDDERIIRETIASLIDWNSLGISLIGTAENGIEALNMILDEYPDIVLTDIKMPGLSGLDLIERIHAVNPDTQFVILSGYGEFKFAQRAMQYGVKHYLLKPCNEEQIINSLTSARQDYLATVTAKRASADSTGTMHHIMMKNILTYYLQNPSPSLENVVHFYGDYLDITKSAYSLFYIYFVEKSDFLNICLRIQQLNDEIFPDISIHLFYVKGTITCFFRSNEPGEECMLRFLEQLRTESTGVIPEFKKECYENLHHLMTIFTKHIRNYEMIFHIVKNTVLPIYNYHNVIKEMYRLVDSAFLSPESANTALSTLHSLFLDISDLDLLRQQASALITYAVSRQSSPNMSEALEYLLQINQLESEDTIILSLFAKLTGLFKNYHASTSPDTLSQRIILYTEENLSKTELSLKWIAENYLYMNVDYLSKRFAKETGMKFSKYLTNLRIQKAKHYMEQGTYNVQEIAELVGCGQNPQYFSQIFKKNTGQSPSQYLHTVQSSAYTESDPSK